MSTNERKTQMNIKWHRQKRLQRIECTDDTALKPTVEIINPEPTVTVPKRLSHQLIEEYTNYNSSDDGSELSYEVSVPVTKRLSEQLIEEYRYYDSSDGISYAGSIEDLDGDFSVRSIDWNNFRMPNESNLAVEFDGPLVNDEINETYLDNNDNSGAPALDVSEPNTSMSRRTNNNINNFEKHRKIPQPKIKKLSMKRKEK